MKVWNITDVHEWEKNPTSVSDEALAELDEQLLKGQHSTALIMPDGTVLGGNRRLSRMKQLGYATIKGIEIDFVEDEKNGWYAVIDGETVKDPRSGQMKFYETRDDGMMDYAMSHNTHFTFYKKSTIDTLIDQYKSLDFSQYRIALAELPHIDVDSVQGKVGKSEKVHQCPGCSMELVYKKGKLLKKE